MKNADLFKDIFGTYATEIWSMPENDFLKWLNEDAEPKMGRWIESKGYDDRDHFYTCSECGRNINLICGAKLSDYPYCHCGAKMVEPQESEVQE